MDPVRDSGDQYYKMSDTFNNLILGGIAKSMISYL